MISGEQQELELAGEPIYKDWVWWSNFLQREYYGTPEEQRAWSVTAAAVAREVGLEPGMRALDLGSGCGELAMGLALHGAGVVGVEQSTTLVEHCTRIARDRGVAAAFVAADMFQYKPAEQFDIVISVNTSFGYGTDEQNRALIRKIGSWLKPGGVFYLDLISSDCAEAFGSWSDEVAGGRLLVDNSYDPDERTMMSFPTWVSPDGTRVYTTATPEVIRLYSRDEMEQMMRHAGMRPRRLQRAMGRKFRQDDAQMLTTWTAVREPAAEEPLPR